MRQEEPMDLWVYEREAFDAGIKLVCGVDEAGRGPLAGPVCAAAVMLPPGLEIPGLNDSKKLTDKKRRELYDVIVEQAVSYGITSQANRRSTRSIFYRRRFLPWSAPCRPFPRSRSLR